MMASASTAFLRFWFEDRARESFLSQADKQDLLNFRLGCQDFAARAAPHVFKDVSVTFRSTTFTKPARLAALKRVGRYVRRFTFSMHYGDETLLPPLLEPTTGAELEVIYTPNCQALKPKSSRAGLAVQDNATTELTELLVKQYPPLYHAAVNVPSFIRAFSYLPNLKHLTVSCPDDAAMSTSGQSIVDYALISLRIAIERNELTKLDHLTLLPVQPHALQCLDPVMGPGSRPNSLRRWRQVKVLTIHMPVTKAATQLKLLHNYISTFSPSVRKLTFHWIAPTLKTTRASALYQQPLGRPSSTGTSYFPPVLPSGPTRGPNPLALHMSSLLRPRAPRQQASAHSLPSMTSASTLSSTDSSSSPIRVKPRLRCDTNHKPSYPPTSSSCPSASSSSSSHSHPTTPKKSKSPATLSGLRPLVLPHLSFFELDGLACSAASIASFISTHGGHLAEFKFEGTTLTSGNWDEALAPLTRLAGGNDRWKREARREEEVPLCLAPELSPIQLSPVRGAGTGTISGGPAGGAVLPLFEAMTGGKVAKGQPGAGSGKPAWAGGKSPLLGMAMGMGAFVGTGMGGKGCSGNSGGGKGTKVSGGQQALEDGVRKLLAQTVFPFF